jgi:hypothetical protein
MANMTYVTRSSRQKISLNHLRKSLDIHTRSKLISKPITSFKYLLDAANKEYQLMHYECKPEKIVINKQIAMDLKGKTKPFVVLDGGAAGTANALVKNGFPSKKIHCITNNKNDFYQMTKAVNKTLPNRAHAHFGQVLTMFTECYDAKDYNQNSRLDNFGKGYLFDPTFGNKKLWNANPGLSGLYLDFNGGLPNSNHKKYYIYNDMIKSLIHNKYLVSGSLFAITSCISRGVQCYEYNKNPEEIINCIKKMFTDHGAIVDITRRKNYGGMIYVCFIMK